MKVRAFVAAVASVACVVAAVSPLVMEGPAGAPPGDATAASELWSGLFGPRGVGPFVQGMATVGAFGQQMPGLTLVPGSSDGIGLADVMDQAVQAVQANHGPPPTVA